MTSDKNPSFIMNPHTYRSEKHNEDMKQITKENEEV